MADRMTSSIQTQEESSPGVRLGRVRWTICAMLFVATSINYMGRQVISILKPTLEHSIGMTEVGYGYIVDAFQIAYALGLLAAGRFVDKVGTRSAVGSVTGIGSMAGSAGGALLATYAGHILQLTHSYASLFGIAAGAYLVALLMLVLFAPGLRKVELAV